MSLKDQIKDWNTLIPLLKDAFQYRVDYEEQYGVDKQLQRILFSVKTHLEVFDFLRTLEYYIEFVMWKSVNPISED